MSRPEKLGFELSDRRSAIRVLTCGNADSALASPAGQGCRPGIYHGVSCRKAAGVILARPQPKVGDSRGAGHWPRKTKTSHTPQRRAILRPGRGSASVVALPLGPPGPGGVGPIPLISVTNFWRIARAKSA